MMPSVKIIKWQRDYQAESGGWAMQGVWSAKGAGLKEEIVVVNWGQPVSAFTIEGRIWSLSLVSGQTGELSPMGTVRQGAKRRDGPAGTLSKLLM